MSSLTTHFTFKVQRNLLFLKKFAKLWLVIRNFLKVLLMTLFITLKGGLLWHRYMMVLYPLLKIQLTKSLLKQIVKVILNLEKYEVKIESDNPIFPWLVRFAAEARTRFKKGPDGMTPYERLKLKKPRARGAPFGEKILFMPIRDAKNKKDKLDGRYDEGIWVGTSNVDGSSIVLTPEGVRSTRSIRRLPDSQKYDLVFYLQCGALHGNLVGTY